ncbi:MAG: redoxin domain-containing protein [Planctomycetes bacterium]|nr:redoxin domain-containing protein [Planctomycetota bacterium]
MRAMIWSVLLCVFASALVAQKTSSLQGKESPDFSATKFINPPKDGKTSLADCKGDVILVKLWGVKCGPCIASMPEVQGLWNKYEGKGLHVFMCERQGHTEAEIQKLYNSKGLTFPQVIEGSMGGFPGVGTIPYAYVIGVDGTVIWEGNHGYVGVVAEEITKIKYLGLGKNEVAPGLEKAATAYSAGDYAAARDEAIRQKEKNVDNEAVAADADYIIGKVNALVDAKLKQVEDAKAIRHYHVAVRILEELTGKAFKGMEVAEKAKEDLDALKKDKAVKDELKAWDAYEKTVAANEKAKDSATKKKNLVAFAKKYEGTAAADEARKQSESNEG